MRPEMQGQALENAVTAMRLGMLMTSFMALLVGVYIIFNSFTIAVNQRWKEIGVLRAIGVERRNVNRDVPGRSAVDGSDRIVRGNRRSDFIWRFSEPGDGIDCGFGLWDCVDRGGAEVSS